MLTGIDVLTKMTIMHGCSLLVAQFEALNFGAWFEALGGSEGGFPFGYGALSLMERK